ncbi:zinc-dependent alcohol dehydrogenase [Aquisalimonas asiatica]|uniref:2-desacetyl-2-hydroxyethyl bacteriochlorophyllide A dehydrogenase n=1 Tax=Aquisalimonas asiatica TaxID=406100 RepID=A0A1H8TKK8_9GAMM|nr:zinc-binding alcohol dehydrogenase [Aquisalimonas asiatica]SEO91094.1 2-desacetyl-2-hydroxyethyl bacteriochlorophyllide A dehydrogenase [Aquisalimonas asiatica]
MSDATMARQFRVQAPGSGIIQDVPLAGRAPSDVLVRMRYSGVSRGTECLVFQGRVPPSQYDAMRAPFQQGRFPGPVAYGYMAVGDVIEGPDSLRNRPVFCLHPHQDYFVVPASAVTPVPETVPAGRAILAANMETAVNAVWDGGPGPGDRINVVGGGVIGMLVAWLCQAIPGTAVTLVDTNPERAGTARALGLSFASAAEAGADVVFHASGQPDGLATALATAGTEATVIDLSWYGDTPVTLPLGEGFHSRRLRIRSSQVGRLPPDRIPRWDHQRRMRLALDLLDDPRLDALITGETPFDAMPTLLPELCTSPGNTLCHRITYA